ncbi:hypothetical protein [Streptomyces sp. NPDC060194]|uniref:hypothetical protein n=1 Tax=Streptomyces sp. NPDC060194 TaxID=3347069 RepID=UPI003657887B
MMLALAREADETGRAALSLERIAALTRLTARSVTTCLKELATLGEISHQRGGGVANPSSYRILLIPDSSEIDVTVTELPTPPREASEEGENFTEAASTNPDSPDPSGNFLAEDMEVFSLSTEGGSTPVGSTTTQEKQASQLELDGSLGQDSVHVPDGAKDLVAAVTRAGMLVGWRLSEAEWDRVTVLAARWGHERLVEMVAPRWNSDRPPQSARYLLRIWADLPSDAFTVAPEGNVVPLRRPSTWAPFQDTAAPSAYQNGF